MTKSVSITSTGINFAGASNANWISNVGLKIDGTELQVCQADGSDFSVDAPGYITVPSTTAGAYVTIRLEATTTAAGTALDENTYPVNAGHGVTTTVAWAQDVPFFLYIVNEDNTAANAGFFLSRNPTLRTTPAVGLIHDTTAIGGTADSQNHISGFWADDAGKAVKPCRIIGAVRRQWSTVTDRWTTQALSDIDGIGEGSINATCSTDFTFAAGQNGAITQGGTATYLNVVGGDLTTDVPTWATSQGVYSYKVGLNGVIYINFSTTGGGNCTNGDVGAQLYIQLPYAVSATHRIASVGTRIAGVYASQMLVLTGGTTQLTLQYSDATVINASSFNNVIDDIVISLSYRSF